MTGEILGGGDTTDTTIYEYDVFNRMDMMSDNGKEWTFEYNADGQRVSKSNGSQSLEYIWNGNNIVSEKNENNQSTYFQRGLSLLTMQREQDNFKHYYFKNAHGDVTGVVDTRTNTIKYSYDYDAFGNLIDPSATNTEVFSSGYNGEVEDTNPFRYAGEYFDREAGMIYLRNRYYIPRYGRFTQQDTYWNPSNMIYGDNQKIGMIIVSDLPNESVNDLKSNLYIHSNNIKIDKNKVVFFSKKEFLRKKDDLTYKVDSAMTKLVNSHCKAQNDLPIIVYTVIRIPDSSIIMQSRNLYVYAMNNAIKNVDPTGEFAWGTIVKPVVKYAVKWVIKRIVIRAIWGEETVDAPVLD